MHGRSPTSDFSSLPFYSGVDTPPAHATGASDVALGPAGLPGPQTRAEYSLKSGCPAGLEKSDVGITFKVLAHWYPGLSLSP
jgi:hypothetical protein